MSEDSQVLFSAFLLLYSDPELIDEEYDERKEEIFRRLKELDEIKKQRLHYIKQNRQLKSWTCGNCGTKHFHEEFNNSEDM